MLLCQDGDDAVSPGWDFVQIVNFLGPLPPRLNFADEGSSILRDGLEMNKPMRDYWSPNDLYGSWVLGATPIQKAS